MFGLVYWWVGMHWYDWFWIDQDCIGYIKIFYDLVFEYLISELLRVDLVWNILKSDPQRSEDNSLHKGGCSSLPLGARKQDKVVAFRKYEPT